MPLHNLSESELRKYCKEYLESLELWLRRLIDDILTQRYGHEYFNFKKSDGSNLISNKIITEVSDRMKNEPERYPRLIDACLLDSEIKIITNRNLYSELFEVVFKDSFQWGNDMLRVFLERLVVPRNKLYHANTISVREAEQIICYVNDIIDAIKKYYVSSNMNSDYNVPLILSYKDSFGNQVFRNQFHGRTLGGGEFINFDNEKQMFMRPGDKIKIEIEIDPTFSKDSYKIDWNPKVQEFDNKSYFSYTIKNKDVGENFTISAKITTYNEWHRIHGFDDFLVVRFRVLPPLI